jgi:hypothetical protein
VSRADQRTRARSGKPRGPSSRPSLPPPPQPRAREHEELMRRAEQLATEGRLEIRERWDGDFEFMGDVLRLPRKFRLYGFLSDELADRQWHEIVIEGEWLRLADPRRDCPSLTAHLPPQPQSNVELR